MNQNISFSLKQRGEAGIKHLNDPKLFMYRRCLDDVYNNINTLIFITQLEKEKFLNFLNSFKHFIFL